MIDKWKLKSIALISGDQANSLSLESWKLQASESHLTFVLLSHCFYHYILGLRKLVVLKVA